MRYVTPLNSLKNLLDKTKDLVDSNLKKGVYSIPCSCGRLYIGETICSMKVRLKEHCSEIMHNKTKSLAVVENYIKNNHYICVEHAKVIATKEHYSKRHIREAVEIEKHPKFFNRDDGLVLSDLWKPPIPKLRNNEELIH